MGTLVKGCCLTLVSTMFALFVILVKITWSIYFFIAMAAFNLTSSCPKLESALKRGSHEPDQALY